MTTAEKSLRMLVEKWSGLKGSRSVRVRLLDRSQSGPARCVCVETQRTAGTVTLFFFQHSDGSWQVFPPGTNRPAMSICRLAA
ncbi:hypothetical protein [Paraburkholderia domus]|uniref:Uncharacterized protein n=1 Tax=Paraburkholderia domus TaxID=2793075 RepID=A0A9N8MTM3_9BURK|nr:hypothetical protein [Paraburkholderia domus]MBK5164854.1 hypothetical protein [Burkholderia sp. R-70211]CAE6871979.1 hypothetical protein R70211_01316 [Paraburkholderia domus]